MSKKEEIKFELDKIWAILMDAKTCFYYSFYLYEPDTQEEQSFVDRSIDFKYFRLILWKMSIIELVKLFSDPTKSKSGDRYDLMRFINKLKGQGHLYHNEINEETILNWENQINDCEIVINKILTLRDKLYAHTDSNADNFKKMEITFEEIERLITIVETIIKDVYFLVFNGGAQMDPGRLSKDKFEVLEILAAERKRRFGL